MQDERLPKSALKYQPVGNKVEVDPRRVGKTSSWKRVEEYRINKPSSRRRNK
jgi:hypothetical protein